MKYWNVQVAMRRITPPLSVLRSRKVVFHAHRQPGGVYHTQWDHPRCYEVRLSFVTCGAHLESLRFSTVCLLYLTSSRNPSFLSEHKSKRYFVGRHSLRREGYVLSVEQLSPGLSFKRRQTLSQIYACVYNFG